MNVLVVTHSFGFNGAAAILKQLMAHWVGTLGWHVHALIAPTHSDNEISGLRAIGVQPVWEVTPSRHDFVLINTFLDIHEINRFFGQLPIVFWVHEGMTILAHMHGQNQELSAAFEKPDLLVFQTPWQPNAVFQPFLRGVLPEKMAIIPCGIEPIQTVRRLSEPTPNKNRVVTLGSVYGRKRPLDLAQAVVLLSEKHEIECAFIGDLSHTDTLGPSFDTFYRHQSCLKWHGAIPHEEKLRILSQSHIACFPSGDETFGMAALESASLSLPVVLADLPVYHEVGWVHRQNCLLYPVGDISALCDCLRELGNSPSLRSTLGLAGQELARSFSMSRFFEDMTHHVQKALERSPLSSKSRAELSMQDREARLRQQVQTHPDDHDAWHELGLQVFGRGDAALAIQCIEAAIALDGKKALYHRNIGEMYRRQGQFQKAALAGRRAVKFAPKDPDAYYNLALAYADAGQHTKAIDAFQKGLALRQGHLPSLQQLVWLYETTGQAARACALRETIDRIQTRTPSGDTVRTTQALAEQLHLEGIDLYRKGEIEKALHAYEKAQALCPDFPALLNSHGFALQDMDRMEEARACFERAVALAPEMDMARLNLAMAQLKMGDWEAGWENYEARWTGSAEAHAGTLQRPAYPLPLWNGEEATENQRLLVITEQGFGDTFQFSRYLPLVAKRFAQVGFVCSQPTQRLMEWAFGDGEQGIITFTRLPSDMTEWDVYCPLMSLPRAFKTRPETIPAAQPPLRVPPTVSQYWRQRLERAAPGRYRVGIAWAGRKAHQYDGRRSLRFEQIRPWLEDPRITWVSLQKWAPDELRPAVPDSVDWIDWTEELTDFADSAGLLSGLDLLISIDSALVHLAGGLGFPPVWMLNRFDMEWRWFRHREDSPWYPQLRIFNQPAFGDWASVLARVHAELKALPLPDVPRAPRLSKPETLPAIRAMSKDWPLAHQWHEQGIAAWQAGKRDEAVAFLEKAIGHDGHVALFHSNLGEMKRQLGRVDEAIAHGRAAVALAPDQAGAHSNLGIALYDAGALDDAQACHEKALDLSPRLLQSINNLGSIERARGQRKAAIRHYRRALEIDPRFVESLSNLGAVLLEDDQPEAAEGPLLQAISIQGEYPEALCTLGLVRMKQGQIAQAIGLLERALVLRPAYPEARAALFALQTRSLES